MHLMKSICIGIAMAGLALVVGTMLAFAEERSGIIKFIGEGVGAGMGYTWGAGTLTFKGHDYPFTVRGLSIVDSVSAEIEGTGDVYNLKRIEDFPGAYLAAGASAAASDGGSVAVLENQNGVRVVFHSKTQGLKLNLSAYGVTVGLK